MAVAEDVLAPRHSGRGERPRFGRLRRARGPRSLRFGARTADQFPIGPVGLARRLGARGRFRGQDDELLADGESVVQLDVLGADVESEAREGRERLLDTGALGPVEDEVEVGDARVVGPDVNLLHVDRRAGRALELAGEGEATAHDKRDARVKECHAPSRAGDRVGGPVCRRLRELAASFEPDSSSSQPLGRRCGPVRGAIRRGRDPLRDP